jgi:hypothetical protein
MTHEPKDLQDPVHEDAKPREDQPIPAASEQEVLEETARLAREGLKERQEKEKRSGGKA